MTSNPETPPVGDATEAVVDIHYRYRRKHGKVWSVWMRDPSSEWDNLPDYWERQERPLYAHPLPKAPIEPEAGLSEWAGWDQSRYPWGETKHKDAVLEALFRGPWSVEDAAALIGFIDRTWTRQRPVAASHAGGERG